MGLATIILLVAILLMVSLNHWRLRNMGANLDALTAAIAAEDTLIGQAIATLDAIPGLITAAAANADPDTALASLVTDIQTQTTSISAALTASGQSTANQATPPAPPAP